MSLQSMSGELRETRKQYEDVIEEGKALDDKGVLEFLDVSEPVQQRLEECINNNRPKPPISTKFEPDLSSQEVVQRESYPPNPNPKRNNLTLYVSL